MPRVIIEEWTLLWRDIQQRLGRGREATPPEREAVDQANSVDWAKMAGLEIGIRAALAADLQVARDKLRIAMTGATVAAESDGLDPNWLMVRSALRDLDALAAVESEAATAVPAPLATQAPGETLYRAVG